MPANPKRAQVRIENVLHGWGTLKSDKSYGGMSLEAFKTAVNPLFAIREEIARLEELLRSKKDQRDDIDKQSLAIAQRIIDGVIAEEGRDSDVYQAMGYVRKSEMKKGLTRKKKEPKPK